MDKPTVCSNVLLPPETVNADGSVRSGATAPLPPVERLRDRQIREYYERMRPKWREAKRRQRERQNGEVSNGYAGEKL